MRREIVVQLLLTALALLLLLFVIFFHQPTYVEEFPEGVSANAAANAGQVRSDNLTPPVDSETLYGPRPAGSETPYRN